MRAHDIEPFVSSSEVCQKDVTPKHTDQKIISVDADTWKTSAVIKPEKQTFHYYDHREWNPFSSNVRTFVVSLMFC